MVLLQGASTWPLFVYDICCHSAQYHSLLQDTQYPTETYSQQYWIPCLKSPTSRAGCQKLDLQHWTVSCTMALNWQHWSAFYQEVLNQPVTECLTNPTSETGDVNLGTWDRPQLRQPRSYQSLVEPLHFIADTRLKVLAFWGILCLI